MIRVFEILCKLNFINFSAKDQYISFLASFDPNEYKCPYCGTNHPDWKKHATYDRHMISFECGCSVVNHITIIRYRCQSCTHTHAILPEFIIPYQSYSFLFILAVMRDYYVSSLTIEGICAKYEISVSTLYAWKKLFLKHKKIWLGLLEDSFISPSKFLDFFSTGKHLYKLKEFFLTAGISFLQGVNRAKKAYFVPL